MASRHRHNLSFYAILISSVTWQHMWFAISAYSDIEELQILADVPQSLIGLKEKLEHDFARVRDIRMHGFGQPDDSKAGDKFASRKNQTIVPTSFLQRQPPSAVMYNSMAKRYIDEYKKLLPPQQDRQFGFNVAGKLGDRAMEKARSTFDAYKHYIINLERLMGATWDYNDKMEEFHDRIIDNFQAPLVEGNFPKDGQEDIPIQVMIPTGGEIYFPIGCGMLTEKSERQLTTSIIPKIKDKIDSYRKFGKDNDIQYEFLVCVGVKTMQGLEGSNSVADPKCPPEAVDRFIKGIHKDSSLYAAAIGHGAGSKRELKKNESRFSIHDWEDEAKQETFNAYQHNKTWNRTLWERSKTIEHYIGKYIPNGDVYMGRPENGVWDAYFNQDVPGGVIVLNVFKSPKVSSDDHPCNAWEHNNGVTEYLDRQSDREKNTNEAARTKCMCRPEMLQPFGSGRDAHPDPGRVELGAEDWRPILRNLDFLNEGGYGFVHEKKYNKFTDAKVHESLESKKLANLKDVYEFAGRQDRHYRPSLFG